MKPAAHAFVCWLVLRAWALFPRQRPGFALLRDAVQSGEYAFAAAGFATGLHHRFEVLVLLGLFAGFWAYPFTMLQCWRALFAAIIGILVGLGVRLLVRGLS